MVNCVPEQVSAEILVLPGTAGAGRMAPPTSTRISFRVKCVQRHILPVNITPRISACVAVAGLDLIQHWKAFTLNMIYWKALS